MLILALLFAQLFFATTAFAATDYASSVESSSLGTQKGGGPLAADRDDPNDALGAPDSAFVSLGYDGQVVLGFPLSMSGNLSVSVYEVTNGVYPVEQAQIAVSSSPAGPWTIVGTADNTADSTTLAVGQCYQYVRVIDTTDETLHNATSDGFDLDAVEATYDEECEVVEEPAGDDGDVVIKVNSSAAVVNNTEANANTGGNSAGGSTGGDGGNGGSIGGIGSDQDIEGASTGTGGNGGAGGDGGLISTGDANASASTRNLINTTDIVVDRCACAGDDSGDTRIRANSSAFLINNTEANANTGYNRARGSRGGDGGNGGSIGNIDLGDEGEGQELDDTHTGSGGTGGAGSVGGTVQSGAATSSASTENITNRIGIRVNR